MNVLYNGIAMIKSVHLPYAVALANMFISASVCQAIDPASTPQRTDIGYFTDGNAPLPLSEQLEAIDPLGNRDWSPKFDQSVRLDIGLQILPSCFKSKRETPTEIKSNMEHWLEEATTLILGCRKKYPELEQYLLQWVSRLRRSVIDCQSDELDLLGKDGRKLIREEAGHYNFKTRVITLSQSYFGHLSNVLIHEVLHETDADNYSASDHNSYERISPGNSGLCGQDSTTDRVSVIESLCSGVPLNASFYNATYPIAERIKNCGAKVGCEELFTNLNFFLSKESKNLDPRKARSLCKKIKYEGQCRKTAESHFASEPHISKLFTRIRNRLDLVLPANNVEIPQALISSFPELEAEYTSLSKSRCFKSMFRTDENGNLYAIVDPKSISSVGGFVRTFSGGHRYQWVQGFSTDYILKDLASWIDSPIKRISSPECSTSQVNALRNWVLKLHAKLSIQPKVSRVLGEIIGHQIDEKTSVSPKDDLNSLGDIIWLEKLPNPLSSSFTALLGKELLEEYLKTIPLYHPSSKSFKCGPEWKALGGFDTIEESIRDTAPVRSCF